MDFRRHAGLVPASNVPHTQQWLRSWNLGPRNKSGVTERDIGLPGWMT